MATTRRTARVNPCPTFARNEAGCKPVGDTNGRGSRQFLGTYEGPVADTTSPLPSQSRRSNPEFPPVAILGCTGRRVVGLYHRGAPWYARPAIPVLAVPANRDLFNVENRPGDTGGVVACGGP